MPVQKCFYHAKSDAVTTCMGCKMPVCDSCRDAGNKGFCDACLKKVSALGDQIKDAKKTGMVQSVHKATMLKTSSRPTAPKNVTYCFQHFDAVAAGTCPSCSRAFCGECLNADGMCTHCAAHAEPAAPAPRKPAAAGGERPAARPAPREARPAPVAAAEPSGLFQPTTFFIFAVVVFLLILAYKVLG